MNYSASVADCMQRARSVGWDLGLSSIKALLQELNNPQDKVPAIHVTGTNGKGSICSFINSICMSAGIRVGRYTSPAVEDEFERYTINNQWISEYDYIKCLETISVACEIVVKKGFRHPSVFEIETALAFLYFSMSECDLMIIEVGMGGLMDATNVMSHPLICVFASIGLDHTSWLGDNLTEITKNKAGIVKTGAYIVSAIQEDEVVAVLSDTAKANQCQISFEEPVINYNLGLEGDIQKQNAAVAISCAKILRLNDFLISDEAITEGLASASWPFRFEHVHSNPDIILDGAHNYPAIKQLRENLDKHYAGKEKTFIISVLKDKSFEEMFNLILPMAKDIIVVESESDRALDLKSLYKTAKMASKKENVKAASSFDEAALLAKDSDNEMIVCFGTFTFLNIIKKELLRRFCND